MNSDAYKYAMEDELEKLGLKARRAGTTAILVGGGFFIAYIIAKKLLSLRSSSKTKKQGEVMIVRPKKESLVVTLIKEQIALFIFAIAKEKLEGFIKSIEKNISTTSHIQK